MEHSIEWVGEMIQELSDADKRQAAVDIQATFWGAAGAFNGGEALSQMEDVIADLSGDDRAIDLQDDPAALRSLVDMEVGAVERVKVSA